MALEFVLKYEGLDPAKVGVFVEMVADLAFIHPVKIKDLGIVTTKVFSKA